MADAETRRPDPRIGLGGPPIGGTPHEGESSRDFTARVRREQRERAEEWEGARVHTTWVSGCACIECATAAAGVLRKSAPRTSRREFRIYDERTWAPGARGRTP
jgi:hypothetical protein